MVGFPNDLEEVEYEIKNLKEGQSRVRLSMRSGPDKELMLAEIAKGLERWQFIKDQLLNDSSASNDNG